MVKEFYTIIYSINYSILVRISGNVKTKNNSNMSITHVGSVFACPCTCVYNVCGQFLHIQYGGRVSFFVNKANSKPNKPA